MTPPSRKHFWDAFSDVPSSGNVLVLEPDSDEVIRAPRDHLSSQVPHFFDGTFITVLDRRGRHDTWSRNIVFSLTHFHHAYRRKVVPQEQWLTSMASPRSLQVISTIVHPSGGYFLGCIKFLDHLDHISSHFTTHGKPKFGKAKNDQRRTTDRAEEHQTSTMVVDPSSRT